MHIFAQKYFDGLSRNLKSIRLTGPKGETLDFYAGLETVASTLKTQTDLGHKIIFIGNGASAAISSHMATDYWKNGGMRAVAFNDSSLLTCISNDFGYQHVFEKPIEMFADPGDVLMAISSSGKSDNILRAVDAARKVGCKVVTLSGFAMDNPLSKIGDYNFYVESPEYGPVEIIHLSICHCICDALIQKKEGKLG